jgi:hypothetical protein
MQALAAGGVGLLIGASVVVAIRLLLLHRRTGGAPELWLGTMLLLSVGFGYPARIAADQGPRVWAGEFMAISHIAIGAGFAFLFVFTRRVFRPEAGWAGALAAGGVIALLGKAVHGCFQVWRHGALPTMEAPMGEILAMTGPVLVGYAWTACEALRYHAAMRRRVNLGLADVTVSNRFLLWGLMATSATTGVALNTGALALRVDLLNPVLLLASAATGLGQAVLLVLAFAPPRAYLAWVRGRAATT